jgi:nucleoid DNA-binding protein
LDPGKTHGGSAMAVKRKKMATKTKAKAKTIKKTVKAAKPAASKATKVVAKRKPAAAKKATAVKRKPAAKKATAVKRKPAVKKATAARKPAIKRAKAATKVAPKSLTLSKSPVSKKQTKAQIMAELSEMTGVSKSDIRNLFVALRNLAERHMNAKGSGQFAIPELGIKIRRVNKKATKARMGRNPFTGAEIKIPAKPARKAVRATVLKSLKEVV